MMIRKWAGLLTLVMSVGLTGCATHAPAPPAPGAQVAQGGMIGSQLFEADTQLINIQGSPLLAGSDGTSVLDLMDRGDIANLKSVIVYTQVNKTAAWTNERRATAFQVTPTADTTDSQGQRCRLYQITMNNNQAITIAGGKICLVGDHIWQVQNTSDDTTTAQPALTNNAAPKRQKTGSPSAAASAPATSDATTGDTTPDLPRW